jgi:signal transduction histidine kinase/ActR/RegA family two-component response regulator
MAPLTSDYLDQRVLLLAPTARDREVTRAHLDRAGIACYACTGVTTLIEEIRRGAGAVLLTEEVITPPGTAALLAALDDQPAWSELPVILLMRGGEHAQRFQDRLRRLANVMLLERPASIRTVVSAVEAGVRARRRQYQIRDQLEEIQRSNAELGRAADERRRLLESEREARTQAERASRSKDEFLATLSHELRTPMTAVLGWAELLRNKLGDRDTVETGLQVIERNARLQSKLIDDLLDLSRIISGKVRLESAPLDPVAVVREAIDSLQHVALQKSIQVEHMLEPIPAMRGDTARLHQVIGNLVSNALKFTPAGGRVLIATRYIDGDAVISVRDNGVGIGPDFLPYVFDRFRQSDPSITRSAGGLGLGLSIVKQLVELQGGEITVQSEGPGRGALFVVRLPVEHARGSFHAAEPGGALADAGSGAEHRDIAGLSVLVVDDDADVRDFMHRLLCEYGMRVETADSAAAALQVVAEARPDVIVSDIGMPDVDGYEFMRRLRAGSHGEQSLPAVALTAFAGEHDRERALAAGYQAHLAKPVNASELFRVLWELTSRRRRD